MFFSSKAQSTESHKDQQFSAISFHNCADMPQINNRSNRSYSKDTESSFRLSILTVKTNKKHYSMATVMHGEKKQIWINNLGVCKNIMNIILQAISSPQETKLILLDS